MYEYCVYVDGNTFTFVRDTYFPIQEFDGVCRTCLVGKSVDGGFFVLMGVLGRLGFKSSDVIGDSCDCIVSSYMSIRREDISVKFNFYNV